MLLLNGTGMIFLSVKNSFKFTSREIKNVPSVLNVALKNNKSNRTFLSVKDSFKFVPWVNPSTPPVFYANSKNDSEIIPSSGKGKRAFLPVKDSFKFKLRKNPSTPLVFDVVSENNPEKISLDGKDKRAFLKVATIAGAGLVASQILPKRAEALIMGSSPTTGVVGTKNASNVRINPATEETLDEVLKTTDLSFDGSGFLNVNVQATSASSSSSFSDSGDVSRLALVDADRHVQVDVLSSALPASASTESTLQTLSFGGVKYSLRLVTSGNYDYVGEASIGSATSSAVWRVKRVDNTSGVSILWAGSGTFNQVWDNYASLTYS